MKYGTCLAIFFFLLALYIPPISNAPWVEWTEWMPTDACNRLCAEEFGQQTLTRSCHACDLHTAEGCIEVRSDLCFSEQDEFEKLSTRNIQCLSTKCHSRNDVHVGGSQKQHQRNTKGRVKRGRIGVDWGVWTSWGCDKPCINGKWLIRTRHCEPEVKDNSKYYCNDKEDLKQSEAKLCQHPDTMKYACDMIWSSWSAWSTCQTPAVCGEEKIRSRECTGFGNKCEGKATDEQQCPCPKPKKLTRKLGSNSVEPIENIPTVTTPLAILGGLGQKDMMIYTGAGGGALIVLLLGCCWYCCWRKTDKDQEIEEEEERNLTNNCTTDADETRSWRGMTGVKLWMNDSTANYRELAGLETTQVEPSSKECTTHDKPRGSRKSRHERRRRKKKANLISSPVQVQMDGFVSAPEQCKIIDGVIQRYQDNPTAQDDDSEYLLSSDGRFSDY